MRVDEICTRPVVTCRRSTSVLEIARSMRSHHVGDVVVVDGDADQETPVGVVTDRDLVVEVMAQGIDPDRLCAEDLISADVVTIYQSELVYDAIWHMRSKGIRRLPVIDARGHLVGVLTADDVTRFLAGVLNDVACIAARQSEREKTTRDSSDFAVGSTT